MADAVDEAPAGIEDEPEVVGDAATNLEAEEVPAIEIRKVEGPFLEARVVTEPGDQDALLQVASPVDGVL